MVLANIEGGEIFVAGGLACVSLVMGILIGYWSAYAYKKRFLAVSRQLANLRGENFRGELSTLGIPRRSTPDSVPATAGQLTADLGPQSAATGEKSELDQLRAELEAERANSLEHETALARHQDALERYRGEAAELSELQQKSDQVVRDLQAEVERLRTELEFERANADQRISAADGEQQPMAEGQDFVVVDSPQVETESWQLRQLHKEHIAMQLQLDERDARIAELTSERDDLRAELAIAEQRVDELRELAERQESAANRDDPEKLAELRRQNDLSLARATEMQAARDAMSQSLERAEHNLVALRSSLEQTQRELELLRTERETWQVRWETSEENLTELQHELQQARSGQNAIGMNDHRKTGRVVRGGWNPISDGTARCLASRRKKRWPKPGSLGAVRVRRKKGCGAP